MVTFSSWVDIDAENILQSYPTAVRDSCNRLLPYVKDFLCAKHPYRKGSVCPFVPPALYRNNIHYTYHPLSQSMRNPSDAIPYIEESISYYIDRVRRTDHFGALIIIFHDGFDIAQLIKIQEISQRKAVVRHAMAGALYPENAAPSLHSMAFFLSGRRFPPW